MKELTARQKEILKFLKTHFSKNGYWPSIREIQDKFNFKSTNAVMGHLRALERKNAITRVSGQARAYQIAGDDEPSQENIMDLENIESIPIYGSIAAGYPDGIEPTGEIGRIQMDSSLAGTRADRRAFALKVRGDSMVDAGIFEGDIVILEPGEPSSGDIVAALIDGETTLKRYIRRGLEHPYLKAENSHYPQMHPVAELIVQGIAKSVVRSLS